MKEIKSKKGNATVYLVLIAVVVIAIAFLYVRLNWQRFKVEAGFGFTVAVIVVVVLLILLLMLRHSIKKAKKEREQKKLEAEQERQAKIAAGEPVPSIGDGKFDAEDIKEAAGIVGDKLEDLVEKGKKEIAEMTESVKDSVEAKAEEVKPDDK